MKKVIVAALFLLLGNRPLIADPTHGDYIFSGGFGLTVSPTFLLINPQLEYAHQHDIFFGPMVQLGVGDPGSLFAVSGTIRTILGDHARVKPSLEAGLGMAFASSFTTNNVGVLFHFGMGFDYIVDRRFMLGTMIRGNLAPPLKTFFISWPIILARMLL